MIDVTPEQRVHTCTRASGGNMPRSQQNTTTPKYKAIKEWTV